MKKRFLLHIFTNLLNFNTKTNYYILFHILWAFNSFYINIFYYILTFIFRFKKLAKIFFCRKWHVWARNAQYKFFTRYISIYLLKNISIHESTSKTKKKLYNNISSELPIFQNWYFVNLISSFVPFSSTDFILC